MLPSDSSAAPERIELRPDVQRFSLPAGGELRDPITGRRFPLDDMQARLVEALDGQQGLDAIARDVLGDEDALPAVRGFVERLDQLGLLAPLGVDADGLARRQAIALRQGAQRRRDRRVADSVAWAASKLPFYRERIGSLAASVQSFESLERLPVTTKTDVRANFPSGLIPEGLDLDALIEQGQAELSTTSGSTGGRLATIRDNGRDVVSERFPGIRTLPGGWDAARIARFTTPLCTGAVCHRGDVPFEDRIVNGTLHLHSSDRVLAMRRKEVEKTLADLEQFKANVLQVDPVYAVALVRGLQRFGLPVPPVAAVLSFFEYCSVLHREILSEAFQAPVTDYLSAADLGGGVAAFECTNHRFHVNEHENVFEVARGGRRVQPGELGELLVTSLNHRFTRLIRYRVGDLGRPVETCGCGWDDLMAFEFEGRLQDCLLTPEGTLITTRAVDQLFVGLKWLDFYQLIQRSRTEFQLLAIRRPETDASADAAVFTERARELLGNGATLSIEYVRDLPVEPSYKYPLTKQTVPGLPGDDVLQPR